MQQGGALHTRPTMAEYDAAKPHNIMQLFRHCIHSRQPPNSICTAIGVIREKKEASFSQDSKESNVLHAACMGYCWATVRWATVRPRRLGYCPLGYCPGIGYFSCFSKVGMKTNVVPMQSTPLRSASESSMILYTYSYAAPEYNHPSKLASRLQTNS
jgi:hypothetical protein